MCYDEALNINIYKKKKLCLAFIWTLCLQEYREQKMYYMDDGPFHRSLALLVQYYQNFADGLATRLIAPVTVGK